MENAITRIKNILQQDVNESRRDNPLFFKTGPGEYAEHDKFLGVTVPFVRKTAKRFSHLLLEEVHCLLTSPYNEERLLALFVIVNQYEKADAARKNELYQFYMSNLAYVNNWNLVDQSADHIVGGHLFDKNKNVLVTLAHSENLWQRRVAMIATLHFIRQLDFEWTFKIAALLLNDAHDLIHKAVGWMLREVGKKDSIQLKAFLDEHVTRMPRTMLRYAIERFSQEERLTYLNSK